MYAHRKGRGRDTDEMIAYLRVNPPPKIILQRLLFQTVTHHFLSRVKATHIVVGKEQSPMQYGAEPDKMLLTLSTEIGGMTVCNIVVRLDNVI